MVLVLRIADKRSLTKLNAFDLVVIVALGSTLATVLLSKDVALGEGVLAFATLASLQWLISRISVSRAWFRTLGRGSRGYCLRGRDRTSSGRYRKALCRSGRRRGHWPRRADMGGFQFFPNRVGKRTVSTWSREIRAGTATKGRRER